VEAELYAGGIHQTIEQMEAEICREAALVVMRCRVRERPLPPVPDGADGLIIVRNGV
jgi:hypothetical protein